MPLPVTRTLQFVVRGCIVSQTAGRADASGKNAASDKSIYRLQEPS